MTTAVGELDGDSWEELCHKVLRLVHANEGYHKVPAQFGGDLGIEGYTTSGIVFQCYCPDGNPTAKELFEHQRDKITKDIKKLDKNRLDIRHMIGVSPIREWRFLTPNYSNKTLLSHCSNKAEYIRSTTCSCIDAQFDILIKIEDDYASEISQIVRHSGFSIASNTNPVTELTIESWNDTNNSSTSVIRSKLTKFITDSNKVDRLVYNNINQYLTGQRELNAIRSRFPEHYESIIRLKNQRAITIENRALSTNLAPGELMKEALDEYINDLNALLAGSADRPTVELLANEAVADWLIRCPLDF